MVVKADNRTSGNAILSVRDTKDLEAKLRKMGAGLEARHARRWS